MAVDADPAFALKSVRFISHRDVDQAGKNMNVNPMKKRSAADLPPLCLTN